MSSPFGLYKDSKYLDEHSTKVARESGKVRAEIVPLPTPESVRETKSKLADAETLGELLVMFGALIGSLQAVTYAYATALKGNLTKAQK